VEAFEGETAAQRPGIPLAELDGDGDIDIVSKIWNKDGPTYHADYWRNDTRLDRFFRSDRGVPAGVRQLPERLEPAMNQRWRVPLAPGHSKLKLLAVRGPGR
jgi:hypothetical protein